MRRRRSGQGLVPGRVFHGGARNAHLPRPGQQVDLLSCVNAECSTVEGNPPPGDYLVESAPVFLDPILEGSSTFATVNGEDVLGDISDNRAASGLFTFTLPKNNVDFFCPDGAGGTQKCPPGPTEAASDGIW